MLKSLNRSLHKLEYNRFNRYSSNLQKSNFPVYVDLSKKDNQLNAILVGVHSRTEEQIEDWICEFYAS